MLYSSEVIETVCDVMHANGTGIPVIVDPVMVAKGGAKLLESDVRIRDPLPVITNSPCDYAQHSRS